MPTTQKWRLDFIGILMTVILALFFAPLAAQNQIDLKRSQEFYEKALQEKKITARLELLQKAAQLYEASELGSLSPAARRQFAAIHFALGREYFQQTKWPAAILHLEKAIAGDPAFFAAPAMLGLIYFQQRKYGEAIAAYNRVLPAQPSAQLYNNLGAAHEANGDLDAAVAAYRRALELDAKLAQAQKNLQRAQEKLVLRQSASIVEQKIAAIDSARRDSLAAVAQKSVPPAAKNNTAKNPKSDRGKMPETKTAIVVGKNKNAPLERKGKPAGQIEAAASSPSRHAALKKDSLATRRPVELDAAPMSAAKTFSPPVAVAAAKESSGPSVFAYLCGAGVVLFGVFIFTQRRRLNRVWLQRKPALATPAPATLREERLIPVATPYAASLNKEKFLTPPAQRPIITEKPGLPPEDDSDEPPQPSLQTQAFFAEMIAAEPEIEAFENELQEAPAELNAIPQPTNGHFDSSLVEAVTVVETNTSAVDDEAQLASLPVVVSVSEQLSVISNQLPVISDQKQEASDQLPVTSVQQQATSKQLSVISGQLSVASDQLPVISDQQQASSYQQPAMSIQHPAPGIQQPASSIQYPTLGRYQIEREIGKGAMGKIYLALDPKLGRRVVLKTVCFNLAASDADTTTIKDRVYREARAIAKLSHPNIVVVYDVEDDQELSYIVMEYIEGQDLRQALKAERRFDHGRVVKIIAQVCSALDYAHHEGIIHRDIKPSNIMLLSGDKVKVTDFGIAKIADNFSLTLPGHVLGTPSYMAPEHFEEETADSRADIFSLGVVFYELLTGGRPFAGDSLAALAYKIVHKMHIPPSLQNVELPLELDEIIGKALAKNPAERFQTAQEFREALLAAKIEAAV
jgi:tRNA A-37 threonylcarbamoyl transferase component Bud32/Flp pilus assembly protein TadD